MSTSRFDPARTRESLLIRLRDLKDQQAWEAFDARYAPMIGGWCRQWFPREKEDMVQEVMLLLARRLRTFEYDPTKLFRGYLKTVTNQLMADLKERALRWPKVGVDGLFDAAEATDDLETRLATEYDLELLANAKANVRGRVEPNTWSAYIETAEQGRKGSDVAIELCTTVGAVHTARWHVLKLLQQEVAFLEHSSGREVLS
jgi:DNA-directed RNA polymerase specialized sigma24 family protein